MTESPHMTRRLIEHRDTVAAHLSDGPVPGCRCKHCRHALCEWCERAARAVPAQEVAG